MMRYKKMVILLLEAADMQGQKDCPVPGALPVRCIDIIFHIVLLFDPPTDSAISCRHSHQKSK